MLGNFRGISASRLSRVNCCRQMKYKSMKSRFLPRCPTAAIFINPMSSTEANATSSQITASFRSG